MGQVLSLGLGKRRLSPSKILGYDSMVGPSSPLIEMLGGFANVVLTSVLDGWLRL